MVNQPYRINESKRLLSKFVNSKSLFVVSALSVIKQSRPFTSCSLRRHKQLKTGSLAK